MEKTIVLIGAGGHGKVCANIAILNGYKNILFLDDNDKKDYPYKIVGTTSDIDKYKGYDFFISIGDNKTRRKLFNEIEKKGFNIPTLIHPFTAIDPTSSIGKGTVVMAGVVVNASANIGKGCILNTSCSVDHDNIIQSFTHISVGTHLGGTVSIGESTFLGIGTVVKNNISITDNCVIGAGAAVVKDIVEEGVYVGVPVTELVKHKKEEIIHLK